MEGSPSLVKRSKTWANTESAADENRDPESDNERAELDHANKGLKEEVKILRKHVHKKGHFLGKRRFLLPFGVLIGVIVGFILVTPSDIEEFHAALTTSLHDSYDINLPPLPILPGVDFTRVETEWARIKSSIPEVWKLNQDGREFAVGEEMRARGLVAQHPVILIPGIISTGLESWSTTSDYRAFFRQKMWGGFNMVTQVTFNREKWIAAMMLDPVTGLDSPGAKIRAAEGIDAASSFIQGYWIWQKIVENLAVVNYDTNNLHLAPYDWRLTYYNLEERDGYFSRLKSTIEGFKKRQGKKVVIAAHSMGSTILLYFLKWVESPEYGGGGSSWVEDHIEATVTIAGTHLGVTKAMAAFLSGEMKDTVQMNPTGAYVLEQFFSRVERQNLFRSWGGSASMWVKGGDDIWGTSEGAPDDPDNSTHTHGNFIAFREEAMANDTTMFNMTSESAGTWILEHTPSSFQKMLETNYSVGIERDEKQLKKNNDDHTKWTNPLEIQLPIAPSMKFYCVYGVGKETERSYWYARGDYESTETAPDTADAQCNDPDVSGCSTPRLPLDMPLSRKTWIDWEYTDQNSIPKVLNGVKMGEGDGTVSLLSLGGMCAEGWKRKRWNPAGIKITTVELPHRPTLSIPRGGANTSEHVDILGSTSLNEIILKVATGVGHEIEDSYVSRIKEYAAKAKWD